MTRKWRRSTLDCQVAKLRISDVAKMSGIRTTHPWLRNKIHHLWSRNKSEKKRERNVFTSFFAKWKRWFVIKCGETNWVWVDLAVEKMLWRCKPCVNQCIHLCWVFAEIGLCNHCYVEKCLIGNEMDNVPFTKRVQ